MYRGFLKSLAADTGLKAMAIGALVVFTILIQVLFYFMFRNAAEQRARTENHSLEFQRAIELEVANKVSLP